MNRIAGVLVAVFAPMIAEAVYSRRNERALRAAGAVEAREDVHHIMQVAYPACFLAMLAEAILRAPAGGGQFALGASLFALAKALKYWAIVSLGGRWSFRVLVPPAAPLVAAGPYRWLRHPNYVAVVGELAGTAFMTRAAIAGPLAIAGFAVLLRARTRVENRALGRS
jgi:methyltransferase